MTERLDRIDGYEDDPERVDDVALWDVDLYRMEMMDNKRAFLCVSHADGTRTSFWVTAARGPLTITCTEERTP